MKIYVDDILLKSKSRSHIDDLAEALAILRRYNMKLNPTKCIFGVTSGKFLDFMVSSQEIEATLKKLKLFRR